MVYLVWCFCCTCQRLAADVQNLTVRECVIPLCLFADVFFVHIMLGCLAFVFVFVVDVLFVCWAVLCVFAFLFYCVRACLLCVRFFVVSQCVCF